MGYPRSIPVFHLSLLFTPHFLFVERSTHDWS